MIRDGASFREATLGRGLRPLPRADPRRPRPGRRHVRVDDGLHRQPRRPQPHAGPLRARCSWARPSSTHIYSAGTIDQWPKNVTSILMYGNMWKIPAPDINRTDLLIIMGGNPQASGGSLLACPDVLGEMDSIRERGGRSSSSTPAAPGRPTGPTSGCRSSRAPTPPSCWPSCHVIFDDGLVDLGASARRRLVDGFDDRRARGGRSSRPEAVADWSPGPGRHHPPTRARVRRHARAPRLRPDRLVQPGVRDARLVARRRGRHRAGPLRRPGRAHVRPTPSASPLAWLTDTERTGRPAVRPLALAGPRRARGARPGPVLVPRRGDRHARAPARSRALFTVAGNPVISVPESDRLEAALPMLDCMISIDNYLNETTRFADVILPGPVAPRERPLRRHPVGAGPRARRRSGREPLLRRCADGQPAEWEILVRLGWYCAGDADDELRPRRARRRLLLARCAACTASTPDIVMPHTTSGGPERMCDLAVRMGPCGDRYGERPRRPHARAEVKAAPDGLDLGPTVPRAAEMIVHAVGEDRPGARRTSWATCPACASPHGRVARRRWCSSAGATCGPRTRGCTTSRCS